MQLNDEVENVEYAVILDGRVLYKSAVRLSAQNFKDALNESERTKANIVPVTANNKQVLFG
jgi:hypothetical protein